MITITDRVTDWVRQHPFHASFMRDGLINNSALARYIKPELEKQAGEILSLEAIILALNRTGKHQGSLPPPDFERYIGEVSVQSNLSILSIRQVDLDLMAFFGAVNTLHQNQEYTLYTRGVWHTALIGKRDAIEDLSKHFNHSFLTHDLIGITVKLRQGHLPVPGVCAYILQKLAFNNINLQEVTSTHDEMTIIIDKNYTQAALNCLV